MKTLKHIVNKTGNILWVAMMAAVLTGCNKILEEKVVSGIGAAHINTDQGFLDATKAMYEGLRKFYGSEMGMTMSELGTDTYRQGSDGSFKHYNQYATTLDPRDGLVSTLWVEFYTSINTCNIVIANSTKVIALNASLVKHLTAEAKALRAHYYFVLTQTFGGVDLRLEPTVGPTNDVTRASEANMYTQIIKDLEEAIAVLSPSNVEWGRYTKIAAENMLAKVYLTRAWRPFGDAADFAKAEQLGKNVINNYGKSLVTDYSKLWELGNDQNSEAIFAVQYSYDLLSAGGDGNRCHLYFLMEYDVMPGMHRVVEQGRPFKRIRPTDYTYNTVMVRRDIDSRYDKSFVHSYPATKTGNFVPNFDKSKTSFTVKIGDTCIYMPGYEMSALERATKQYQVITPSMYTDKIYACILKFLDPKRATVTEERGGRDFYVGRLAETYLVVAEALIKQNKNSDAVPFVNAVRTRAAYPGKQEQMKITTAQANMTMIIDERARELLGEHYRWFDLKRWSNLVERVKQYNPEGNPNVKAHHLYRPIPQAQIDRATGGKDKFPQNDGY